MTSTFIAATPAARAEPRAMSTAVVEASAATARASLSASLPGPAAFAGIAPHNRRGNRRDLFQLVVSARRSRCAFCSSSRSTDVVSNSAAANAGDCDEIAAEPDRRADAANVVLGQCANHARDGSRPVRRPRDRPSRSAGRTPSAPSTRRRRRCRREFPVPTAPRRCVIRPGDGRNPSSGFSA